MKIILIEDEQLALEHLEMLVKRYDSSVEIVAQLSSVQSAIDWFSTNPSPDLAFFDIQLADGSSFEILDQIAVQCPIIFATAYQEYTLKAFKVNGIDYILKPYDYEEIEKALNKYKQLRSNFAQQPSNQLDNIRIALQSLQKDYKKRFLVKSGSQLLSIQTSEISYFFHENKIVWLKTLSNKKYAVDYILDQLEQLLDPKQFFRINRKYFIAYDSIQKVINYSNSRLKLQLVGASGEEEIIVSRERVKDFKTWLD
ncbi:MAG: LytTR family DNA-binding domain-containing protein [Bacteroidota bacterium]